MYRWGRMLEICTCDVVFLFSTLYLLVGVFCWMICMAKLLLISKATMFLFMSLHSLKNSIKKSCSGLNDYYYNLPVQVSLEQGMSQYSRIKSSLKSTLWYLLRLTLPDILSLSLYFCTVPEGSESSWRIGLNSTKVDQFIEY